MVTVELAEDRDSKTEVVVERHHSKVEDDA